MTRPPSRKPAAPRKPGEKKPEPVIDNRILAPAAVEELELTWKDPPGFWGWLVTTDHKRVARRYLVTAFLGLAANLVLFASFFQLRRSEPELVRPFRAWGYPWLPLLITFASAGLLIAFVFADPFSSAIAVGAIVLGLPLFAWFLTTRRLIATARS